MPMRQCRKNNPHHHLVYHGEFDRMQMPERVMQQFFGCFQGIPTLPVDMRALTQPLHTNPRDTFRQVDAEPLRSDHLILCDAWHASLDAIVTFATEVLPLGDYFS
ncbi:hypothetical protein AKJ16_DCAP23361 [Drosera capensis]